MPQLAELNRAKPFGNVFGLGGTAYEQDNKLFNHLGFEIYTKCNFELPSDSLIAKKGLALLGKIAQESPEGDFVEVGVYKGGSAFVLYQIAQRQKRKLHLFDTFSGMPWKHNIDIHPIGHFTSSYKEIIKKFPLAYIYQGIFPDTLPNDLADIAFCHIDCDQYLSTKLCCEKLYPRLVDNGIIYFDDYGCLEGATKAVDEYFANKINTNHGKAFVIKER